MQHFDGEIEKLIRAGNIDIDTGMAYATNSGNLRLLLADLGEVLPPAEAVPAAPAAKDKREQELEIE